MMEALVMFFSQRLGSLLLQETEIFSGLEDPIERINCRLREIGRFLQGKGNTEGDATFSSWENEVRDLVHDIDDHVDEFIIQMDQQNDSDTSTLKDCFISELQKIEFRLAETVHRLTELQKSTTNEGEKAEIEEDSKNQSHERKEDETEPKSTAIEVENNENEGNNEQSQRNEGGQTSSESVPFILKYMNLPYYLQSCLMYCCIFPENYWIKKGKLIRLLVAEGLTQETGGRILEDVAEDNINELISQGMLQVVEEHPGNGAKLTVSSPYRTFLRKNFTTTPANPDSTIPHTARRVLTSDVRNIAHNLNNIRPRTLFLFGDQDFDEANWLNFRTSKFLRVLDVEGAKIKSLPDEVVDLIHLTYLGLKKTELNELPARLGKLRALQTLDIRWCGNLTAVSTEVLNLLRLRHLKMFKNINCSGVEVPEGIERLTNLLTLTGVHPGGRTARELGYLTQLRRLGVMDIDEENASELYASITKMQDLLCLSLEAKYSFHPQHHTFPRQCLVLLDLFSPPPFLGKLRLEGSLEKIPNWLGSMENLTKLRLGFSHLSENPMLVLQHLPNLINLTLWQAYDAKQLGKDFCYAGGFPKLEVLCIASHVLEEWTEIEEGALPNLQYLEFRNCLRLRMLPEGLQFVTTLKQLDLIPLLDDHEERLKPDGGKENYKIRHIPNISFFPMRVLNSMVRPPCPPPVAQPAEETSEE